MRLDQRDDRDDDVCDCVSCDAEHEHPEVASPKPVKRGSSSLAFGIMLTGSEFGPRIHRGRSLDVPSNRMQTE